MGEGIGYAPLAETDYGQQKHRDGVVHQDAAFAIRELRMRAGLRPKGE
jgi:hypothetical protein